MAGTSVGLRGDGGAAAAVVKGEVKGEVLGRHGGVGSDRHFVHGSDPHLWRTTQPVRHRCEVICGVPQSQYATDVKSSAAYHTACTPRM
jgi:hypothetical protein